MTPNQHEPRSLLVSVLAGWRLGAAMDDRWRRDMDRSRQQALSQVLRNEEGRAIYQPPASRVQPSRPSSASAVQHPIPAQPVRREDGLRSPFGTPSPPNAPTRQRPQSAKSPQTLSQAPTRPSSAVRPASAGAGRRKPTRPTSATVRGASLQAPRSETRPQSAGAAWPEATASDGLVSPLSAGTLRLSPSPLSGAAAAAVGPLGWARSVLQSQVLYSDAAEQQLRRQVRCPSPPCAQPHKPQASAAPMRTGCPPPPPPLTRVLAPRAAPAPPHAHPARR